MLVVLLAAVAAGKIFFHFPLVNILVMRRAKSTFRTVNNKNSFVGRLVFTLSLLPLAVFALPGQLDTSFSNINLQNNNNNTQVLPLADGRVLLGFNNVSPVINGVNAGAVIRLGTNGALDGTFAASDTNSYIINNLANLTGGNVLVNGNFTNWAGTGRKYLVKLDSNGAVQTGFTSGVNSSGKLYIAEQPDGKILVAGNTLTTTNGVSISPLQRLLADGSRDTNFFTTNIFAINQVFGFDLVPDGSGRCFVSLINPNTFQYQVVRLNVGGTVDTNFATATLDSSTTMIKALPNGGVMIGGYVITTHTSSFGTVAVGHLLRVNPNGSVDTSFAFTDTRYVASFAVQSDGKVIIPSSTFGVDRFNANGSLSADWTPFLNYGAGPPAIDFADRVLFASQTYSNAVYRLQSDASYGAVPPFFTQAATNQSVYPGDNATFALTAFGPGTITYQWQFKSNNIPYATNAAFTLVNCQLTNGGFYRLVAANSFGTNASTNGLLTLRLDPRVTQSPSPVAADASDTVTFTVIYASLYPVNFQWLFNGNPISGATNNPFVITPVSSTNVGNYSVSISNSYGTNTSATAALTVNSTLRIKQQPVTNILMFAGTATNLLSVAAGNPPLSYQWLLNGAILNGATTSNLVFNPTVRTNSGNYQLVVTNSSGAVTSSVASVAIFGNGQNSWLNINAEPGFGATANGLSSLVSDGALGVVLAGPSGVARYDDDGALRWLTPFLPATNVVSSSYSPPALAVDGRGNTYVAAGFRRTVSFGGLSVTNPGIVSANNAYGSGTFLAKLDSNGQAVWVRYIDGSLDLIKVAADGSGAVLISGNHTDKINFGTQSAMTNSYRSATVARYLPDGTFQWLRDYQFYSTFGAVEPDALIADGTNLWVGGIFHGSMKFGTFTTANGSPGQTYWFGRMDTNGNELWLQTGTPGTGAQGLQLYSGADQSLWAANSGFSDSLLTRFATNGVALFYKTSDSTTARIGSLTVDSNNVAVVNGMFNNTAFIGTNYFDQPGTLTNNFYTARYGTNGIGVGAVVNGYSTYLTSYGFQLGSYFSTGNRRGDVYVAGFPTVKLGATNLTGTNVFLAKLNAPVLSPYITTQPNPGYINNSLSYFQLAVTAGGQALLNYQWRKNGLPIPAGTNATLVFTTGLPTDNGSYDCVISNAYGTISTTPSQLTFTPPFSIYQQPNSVDIVWGTNDVTGADITANVLAGAATAGRKFNMHITNGSGMWPMTANFTLNLASSSSFNIPAGDVGAHAGSWSVPAVIPNFVDMKLDYWSTSPSNVQTAVLFTVGGGFGMHHDITDPAGCCADGYFTIAAGGSSNAVLSTASTGYVLPSVQWYRNGIPLVGQTNNTLNYSPAGYAQVGTYTATFTYSNYVVTTTPSTIVIYPPALGYTFVPGSSSMTFTIPPGYKLQSTTTLASPNWITISTASSYTTPANLLGAYFRIVP